MNNNVINQTKDKKYTKAELITIDSIRRVKNKVQMYHRFEDTTCYHLHQILREISRFFLFQNYLTLFKNIDNTRLCA